MCGQPSIRDILEPHYKEDWGGVSKNTVYGLFKVISCVSNKKLTADDHSAVLPTHLTQHYLQNIYLGYGSFCHTAILLLHYILHVTTI